VCVREKEGNGDKNRQTENEAKMDVLIYLFIYFSCNDFSADCTFIINIIVGREPRESIVAVAYIY